MGRTGLETAKNLSVRLKSCEPYTKAKRFRRLEQYVFSLPKDQHRTSLETGPHCLHPAVHSIPAMTLQTIPASPISLVGETFFISLPAPVRELHLFKDLLRCAVRASSEARQSGLPYFGDSPAKSAQSISPWCPHSPAIHARAVELGLKTSYTRMHCQGGDEMFRNTMYSWLAALARAESFWSAALTREEQQLGKRSLQALLSLQSGNTAKARSNRKSCLKERLAIEDRMADCRRRKKDLIALGDLTRFTTEVLKALQKEMNTIRPPPSYPEVIKAEEREPPSYQLSEDTDHSSQLSSWSQHR